MYSKRFSSWKVQSVCESCSYSSEIRISSKSAIGWVEPKQLYTVQVLNLNNLFLYTVQLLNWSNLFLHYL